MATQTYKDLVGSDEFTAADYREKLRQVEGWIDVQREAELDPRNRPRWDQAESIIKQKVYKGLKERLAEYESATARPSAYGSNFQDQLPGIEGRQAEEGWDAVQLRQDDSGVYFEYEDPQQEATMEQSGFGVGTFTRPPGRKYVDLDQMGFADFDEARAAHEDWLKTRLWNEDESRQLSNGQTVINPGLILKPEEYNRALDNLDVSPQEKARLRDYRLAVRDQFAEEMAATLEQADNLRGRALEQLMSTAQDTGTSVTGGPITLARRILRGFEDDPEVQGLPQKFKDYRAEQIEQNPNASPADIVEGFIGQERGLSEKLNLLLVSKMTSGTTRLLNSYLRTAAFMGSEAAEETSENLSEGLEQAESGLIAQGLQGAGWQFGGQAVEMVPQIAEALTAGGLVRSGLKTALPRLGRTGLTAAAVGGSAIASGKLSAAEAYNQIREGFMAQGMSEEEAEANATQQALGAGAFTVFATAALGPTGIDRVLAGPVRRISYRSMVDSIGRNGIRGALRSPRFRTFIGDAMSEIGRQATAEGIEEAIDEIYQTTLIAGESNPQLGMPDILSAGVSAFLLGATAGAGVSTLNYVARNNYENMPDLYEPDISDEFIERAAAEGIEEVQRESPAPREEGALIPGVDLGQNDPRPQRDQRAQEEGRPQISREIDDALAEPTPVTEAEVVAPEPPPAEEGPTLSEEEIERQAREIEEGAAEPEQDPEPQAEPVQDGPPSEPAEVESDHPELTRFIRESSEALRQSDRITADQGRESIKNVVSMVHSAARGIGVDPEEIWRGVGVRFESEIESPEPENVVLGSIDRGEGEPATINLTRLSNPATLPHEMIHFISTARREGDKTLLQEILESEGSDEFTPLMEFATADGQHDPDSPEALERIVEGYERWVANGEPPRGFLARAWQTIKDFLQRTFHYLDSDDLGFIDAGFLDPSFERLYQNLPQTEEEFVADLPDNVKAWWEDQSQPLDTTQLYQLSSDIESGKGPLPPLYQQETPEKPSALAMSAANSAGRVVYDAARAGRTLTAEELGTELARLDPKFADLTPNDLRNLHRYSRDAQIQPLVEAETQAMSMAVGASLEMDEQEIARYKEDSLALLKTKGATQFLNPAERREHQRAIENARTPKQVERALTRLAKGLQRERMQRVAAASRRVKEAVQNWIAGGKDRARTTDTLIKTLQGYIDQYVRDQGARNAAGITARRTLGIVRRAAKGELDLGTVTDAVQNLTIQIEKMQDVEARRAARDQAKAIRQDVTQGRKDLQAMKKTVVDYINGRLRGADLALVKADISRFIRLVQNAKTEVGVEKAMQKAAQFIADAEGRQRYRRRIAKHKLINRYLRSGYYGDSQPAIEAFRGIDPREVPPQLLGGYDMIMEHLTARVGAAVRFGPAIDMIPRFITEYETVKAASYVEPEDRAEDESAPASGSQEADEEAEAEFFNLLEEIEGKIDQLDEQGFGQDVPYHRYWGFIRSATRDELSSFEIPQLRTLLASLDNALHGAVDRYFGRMAANIAYNRLAQDLIPVLFTAIRHEMNITAETPLLGNVALPANYQSALYKAFMKWNEFAVRDPNGTARKLDSVGLHFIDDALGTGDAMQTLWVNPASLANTQARNEAERLTKPIRRAYIAMERDGLLPAVEAIAQTTAGFRQMTRVGPVPNPIEGRRLARRDFANSMLAAAMLQREREANGLEGNWIDQEMAKIDGLVEAAPTTRLSEEERTLKRSVYSTLKLLTGDDLSWTNLERLLSPAQKKMLDLWDQASAETGPKLFYTHLFLYSGDPLRMHRNYFPHSVQNAQEDMQSLVDREQLVTNVMDRAPSTRVSASYNRGDNTVKPVSWDAFGNMVDAIQNANEFYHLTPVIQGIGRALKQIERSAISDDGKRVMVGVKQALARNASSMLHWSTRDQRMSTTANTMVAQTAYSMTLSDPFRIMSELPSNTLVFSLQSPIEYTAGLREMATDKQTWERVMFENNAPIFRRSGAFTMEMAEGRLTGTLLESIRDPRPAETGASYFVSNRARQLADGVTRWAVTQADTIAARPAWVGRFMASLAQQTARPFDKAALVNGQYSQDQIQRAIGEAEAYVDRSVAPSDPAKTANILRNEPGSRSKGAFFARMVLRGLTGFSRTQMMLQLSSLREIVKRGNTKQNRLEASARVVALSAAASMYNIAMYGTYLGIRALLGDDEDRRRLNQEFDNAKTIDYWITTGLGGFLSTLIGGRNSIARVLSAWGIESINALYHAKRNGFYDPYQDDLVYNVVPVPYFDSGQTLSYNMKEAHRNVQNMGLERSSRAFMGVMSIVLQEGIEGITSAGKTLEAFDGSVTGRGDQAAWAMADLGLLLAQGVMGVPGYKMFDRIVEQQKDLRDANRENRVKNALRRQIESEASKRARGGSEDSWEEFRGGLPSDDLRTVADGKLSQEQAIEASDIDARSIRAILRTQEPQEQAAIISRLYEEARDKEAFVAAILELRGQGVPVVPITRRAKASQELIRAGVPIPFRR